VSDAAIDGHSLAVYASREAIKHHWHGDLIALTLSAELRHVNNQQATTSWRTCLLLQ